MQTFLDPPKCSGCHACSNICPKNCIEMRPDDEGFLHPVIDSEKCIDCGLCKKACPILSDYSPNPIGTAYACINKDDEIRMQSSSGGIFTLLAEHIINQGGVVYGAAFDDDFSVKHIEVDKVCDLYKLRGSKYVQSRIGDTFKSAKEHLEQGKPVLFSGTPCQISGLKTYLRKDYANLILQDFICHGVPSPKIWQKYVKFREDAAALTARQISFRHKESGWKTYSMQFVFSNNHTEYTKALSEDLYMRGFLGNLCLRPSCYDCHSKSIERESDVTLADFWGVDKLYPKFFDDKGTSLVFVNSDKGKKVFDEIKSRMRFAEVDLKKAVSYNSSAFRSVSLPKNRKQFMSLADTISFDKAIDECIKRSFSTKLKTSIKIILRKVIK